MDLSGPFRGSLALLTGSLTRGVLSGPRHRGVFPDIHVPADLELDLRTRSRAAALLVEVDGVLSGRSAAEPTRPRRRPRDDVLALAGLHRRLGPRVNAGGRALRLDLAYPAVRLGIEYDGREHRSPERAMRDLEREALRAADGWKVLRFDAATVHRPRILAAAVRTELARRCP